MRNSEAKYQSTKFRIYLYPHTDFHYQSGINDYIPNLVNHLGERFIVVNRPTKVGLIDLFKNLFKCDIIYFNWIEDHAHKKFGYFQAFLLSIILIITRVTGVKVVWFIHNDISHQKTDILSKRFIVFLMRKFSDVILSHVNEVKLNIDRNRFHSFDHPIGKARRIESPSEYEHDFLIWGTVAGYKGVSEFVEYVAASSGLQNCKILIAGKFLSDEYFESVMAKKSHNVKIRNESLSEYELERLMSASRYVLFTYKSASVLSSAALCKTLSFGKEIIGPNAGAFQELSSKGIIHSYEDFRELEILMNRLMEGKTVRIARDFIYEYADRTTWQAFSKFIYDRLVGIIGRPANPIKNY